MNEWSKTIGILAYGSLGGEPGVEIGPSIVDRIESVKTPFRVEFARTSRKRGGAPTLVPVAEGGAQVKAKILVLEKRVSEAEATDMVWRRETRKVGSGESYKPSPKPGDNEVLVRRLEGFEGLDVVLYVEIGANIPDPSPRKLAKLAIKSAESDAGSQKKDGITYLIGAKENGVETPLMPEYEKEILHLTGAETLEQARGVLAR